MKIRTLVSILILLSISSLSFAQKQKTNVNLVFETKNSNGETATLHNFSILGTWQEVAQAEPDENGILSFSIHLDKPERFLIIYKSFTSSNLLLEPNRDYRFYVDYENAVGDITNENSNDLINLFFGQFREIDTQPTSTGKKAYELKGQEKAAAFAFEEERAEQFVEEFIKKYNPQNEEKEFIRAFVKYSKLGFWFNHMMGGENYKNFEEIVNSPELNRLFNKIDFDEEFLELSPSDYDLTLSYYFRFYAVKTLLGNYAINKWEEINMDVYKEVLRSIPKMEIPEKFRAFILASQTFEVLQQPKGYEFMMEIFASNFPNSEYIPFLRTAYEKTHEINGKLAPEIRGVDAKGDTISLSSLKGKVVYIDFWATWCKPCVAEFPHSIALKKKLEEYSDVVFLYVSIDNEKDKWLNFIAKKPELSGIHLNGSNDFESNFEKTYGINGIPHYSLINKEGIMVKVKAPRPSDESTLDLIWGQL